LATSRAKRASVDSPNFMRASIWQAPSGKRRGTPSAGPLALPPRGEAAKPLQG
jgi:hypothetical protein